jgi:hypothetical protein
VQSAALRQQCVRSIKRRRSEAPTKRGVVCFSLWWIGVNCGKGLLQTDPVVSYAVRKSPKALKIASWKAKLSSLEHHHQMTSIASNYGRMLGRRQLACQRHWFTTEFFKNCPTVSSISRESPSSIRRAKDMAPTSALKVKIALDLALLLSLLGSNPAIN